MCVFVFHGPPQHFHNIHFEHSGYDYFRKLCDSHSGIKYIFFIFSKTLDFVFRARCLNRRLKCDYYTNSYILRANFRHIYPRKILFTQNLNAERKN